MKRNFLGLSIAMMAFICMGCSNPTTDTPVSDTVITLLAIPGVVTPVRGASPVTTAIDSAQYTGTITWSPAVSQFAEKTVYTANIVLTAKAGWTLTGVAADSFSVAGYKATNAANTGTVTMVFPATFAAPILTMVTVPAGSFQRDSTSSNISTISAPFQMSTYEITRTQFESIMGKDPSNPAMSNGTDDPVFLVTWYDAIAFCNKLSIAEGLAPVYSITGVNFTTLTYDDMNKDYELLINPAVWDTVTATWTNSGYRLPTEMEWAWAAMGATSDSRSGDIVSGVNTGGYTKAYAGSTETADAKVYIGDYAWISTNASSKTHPVGTAGTTGHPNELGLYDMSGNVWEWCWDWYKGYVGTDSAGTLISEAVDGTGRGPASGTNGLEDNKRVLRGGSRNIPSADFIADFRTRDAPGSFRSDFGFRVVRR
jgi:formylglycine-generating enzyme required for sulfatase activity